jgi:hypothetical protein
MPLHGRASTDAYDGSMGWQARRKAPRASTVPTPRTARRQSKSNVAQPYICRLIRFVCCLCVPHDLIRVANPTAWTVHVATVPRAFRTAAAVDQKADWAFHDRQALPPSRPAPTIGTPSKSACRFCHLVAPFWLLCSSKHRTVDHAQVPEVCTGSPMRSVAGVLITSFRPQTHAEQLVGPSHPMTWRTVLGGCLAQESVDSASPHIERIAPGCGQP